MTRSDKTSWRTSLLAPPLPHPPPSPLLPLPHLSLPILPLPLRPLTFTLFPPALQKLLNKVCVGHAARCLSFSSDGEMLAVGLKNGEFLVLLTNSLKVWTKRRDRNAAIQDLR